MSDERIRDETGVKQPGPSELARRIVTRLRRGGFLVRADLAAARVFIDRELAKVHAIPAETLDQAIEQLEAHVTACECAAPLSACALCRETLSLLPKLRAARSEGK